MTAAALGAGPRLDGPLVVGMVFALRRPASARKRDVAPFRTPGLSKLARSTEDAIYAPLAEAYAGWPVPGVSGAVCATDII